MRSVTPAASASARETKNSRLPFGPRTGDSATPSTRAPHSGSARDHVVDDAAVHLGIADDPALAHVGRAGLELRLHERERAPPGRRTGQCGWKGLGEADEGDVGDEEGRTVREVVAAEVTDVRALEDGHARVLPQLRMKLPVPDVERDHPRGPGLEQAVGEATRGGAHVEHVLAVDIDFELLERRRELLTAAGDEACAGDDLELGRLVDLLAGLGVALDAPGQDERLRLRARLGQPALDEQHIQALLGAHSESVPRQSPGEVSRKCVLMPGRLSSRSSPRAPWRGHGAVPLVGECPADDATLADEGGVVLAERPRVDRDPGGVTVDRAQRVADCGPFLHDAVQERQREPVPGEDQLAVALHRLDRRMSAVARIAAQRFGHPRLEVALALEVVGERAPDVLVPAGREALDQQRAVERDEERRVARLRQQLRRGPGPELQAPQPRQRRERVGKPGLGIALGRALPANPGDVVLLGREADLVSGSKASAQARASCPETHACAGWPIRIVPSEL